MRTHFGVRCPLIAALLPLAVVLALDAQQPNEPRVGYVYPAGGQHGTSATITIGGRFLDGVNRVLVSGDGVTARIVEHSKPLTQRELTELREKLRTLQGRGADPAARKEAAELRLRIADSLRRNMNPTVGELVTVEVSIAPDAKAGARFMRIGTPRGLSNPLVFDVGELQEFRERDAKTSPADGVLAITIPATVNGRLIPGDADPVRFAGRQGPQYMPGDVDRYRFSARKGQHLTVAVRARALMPYLADAVPGWFQATVALVDADGRELAYADDDRFNPDPVLRCTIPADGEYAIEIKDALYRGREDFVYRVAIGELHESDAAPISRADEWSSLPQRREREPNNSSPQAQSVTVPVVIDGRIDRRGDWDVFSFRGRRGDRIAAEVLGRRLGSPIDSVLELVDAGGRRVAMDDDHPQNAWGLQTHDADSVILAALPADGVYAVRIGDVQRQGGHDYRYRLRIGAPRPDFQLRMAPSAINAIGGATVPLIAEVQRIDGFDGNVELTLRDAPPGFVLSGGVIPAGQNRVRLTLSIPPTAARQTVKLQFEGRATVGGASIVRQAVPTDEMMQAFAYHHLVDADGFYVSIAGRGAAAPMRISAMQPVQIPVGGSAPVRIPLPAYRGFDKIDVALSDPPAGVTVGQVVVNAPGAEVTILADAHATAAGSRGNLIFMVSGERIPPAAEQQTAARASRRVPLGLLPAVPYEIVKPAH